MYDIDNEFYQRADAHIRLCNDQISTNEDINKVGASSLYATSRFLTWSCACAWNNGEEMAGSKSETIDYLVGQYRKMLEENIDDYIKNFDAYMK